MICRSMGGCGGADALLTIEVAQTRARLPLGRWKYISV
jgi:hypothetical protein